MNATLMVGQLVFNVRVEGCEPNPYENGAKSEVAVELEIGGLVMNAAVANELIGGGQPAQCLITGPQQSAFGVADAATAQFTDARVVNAAAAHRVSAIVPGPGPDTGDHIFTNRPDIVDPDRVSKTVESILNQGQFQFLVLGSFGVRDQNLVSELIDLGRTRGARVYFAPTNSQLRNCQAFLELVCRFDNQDWIQLNHVELRLLTGCRDIVRGVNWLREQGLQCSLLVTAGAGGLYAFDAGRGTWAFQRAFDVVVVRDDGAGDCIVGTFVAALAESASRSQPVDLQAALRLCAAAAALHVSGQSRSRQGGWRELDLFAERTRELPFQPPSGNVNIVYLRLRKMKPVMQFAAGAMAACLFFLLLASV